MTKLSNESVFNTVAELIANRSGKIHSNIALIVVTGSVAMGTSTQFSDLDMYAVGDSFEGIQFPHFSIHGSPVGCGRRTWTSLEQITTGQWYWSVAASHIMNGKIIYSRSSKDEKRFISLRNKITSELNYHRELIEIAIHNFTLEEILLLSIHKEQEDLISARRTIWSLIISIVQTLSRINNQYFTSNWDKNIHEALALPIQPSGFSEKLTRLVVTTDFDEMISLAKQLKLETRLLLVTKYNQLIENHPLEDLGYIYIEYIRTYVQKARAAAHRKDILGASYAAAELQLWVAKLFAGIEGVTQLKFNNYFHFYSETGAIYKKMGFPDLSQTISDENFELLNIQVQEIDHLIQTFCKKNKVSLNIFDSMEQVERHINQVITNIK